MHKLLLKFLAGGVRREVLYDRLYAQRWGETTTNNYGFAPAEGQDDERFQAQLYTELVRLLKGCCDLDSVERVLEVSCGRGGGLGRLVRLLPRRTQTVGLDYSSHAIRFCRHHYAAVANLSFVRGHALHLPFPEQSFDVVINVEASHAYGEDARFLHEVRRVLRTRGHFLYADYRLRRKVPQLVQLAQSVGLDGELHDITANVVSACECDAERRRRLIRTGLPWYARLLLASSLERYSGLPGTRTFERFRSGDRMYFLTCMTGNLDHTRVT